MKKIYLVAAAAVLSISVLACQSKNTAESFAEASGVSTEAEGTEGVDENFSTPYETEAPGTISGAGEGPIWGGDNVPEIIEIGPDSTVPAIEVEGETGAPITDVTLPPNISDMGTSGSDEAAGENTGTEEISASSILKAVQEAYGENYRAESDYDGEMLSILYGIEPDMYEEFAAQGSMIRVNIDSIVIVKAAEGKADQVEQIFTDYREQLVSNSMQYPMNIAQVQTSQVLRHGDYVAFVMLGNTDQEADQQGEEAALESSKAQNQIAIDAINGMFEKL